MLNLAKNVSSGSRRLNKMSLKCNVVRFIPGRNIHSAIAMTTETTKPFSEIPGPSSLPLVGPLRHFLPGGNLCNLNRQEVYKKLYDLYGPIVKLDSLFNQPTIVFLYDAEASAKVLRGEEPTPHRPKIGSLEMYREKYNKQHSIGALVNSMGPDWQWLRSAANKVMMEPKVVAAAYSKILNEIAQEAVARFQSKRNENNTIANIDEEIKLWALESTGAVTLGRRLHCFNRVLQENSYEKRLISVISSAFEDIENVDYRPNSFKYLYFGQYKKVMHTFSELETVIQYFLNKTMEEIETKKSNNQFERSTLEKLFEMNKDAALGVATDSMIAGVDSVSQNMMFILYLLGINQDKQAKLRDEVLSGKEKKPYLRACIKEASRMLPTVGVIGRLTTKTQSVLGYEIPKGIAVVSQHGIMSMMEEHYPSPKKFIPERWIVDKDHPLYYGNAHHFAHLPFGFGVRTCIGRRVAELTMEALIVNMVKNFNVKWEGPEPKININIISKMQGPFHYIFENVNNQ